MTQVEIRREQVKGGRWVPEEVLLDVADQDGWRVVVQRAHRKGDEGNPSIRVLKYHPDGRFYFCEFLTLKPSHWERLKEAIRSE